MADNIAQENVESKDGLVLVSGRTNTKGLATCIFAVATKEQKSEVKLRGIGHGAIGQMTKAFIIAKGKLAEKGIKATVDMYFKDLESSKENEDKITGVEYLIKFEY